MPVRRARRDAGVGLPADPEEARGAGVKDMIRISDARMSGTAFGTIVLHVTPESRGRRPAGAGAHRRPDPPVGAERRLDLMVDEEELARRRAAFVSPCPTPRHGAAMTGFMRPRCFRQTRAAISPSGRPVRPPPRSRCFGGVAAGSGSPRACAADRIEGQPPRAGAPRARVHGGRGGYPPIPPSRSNVARMWAAEGSTPVNRRNAPTAWNTAMPAPDMVRHPAARAAARSAVSSGT
jgi:hypothetical protein